MILHGPVVNCGCNIRAKISCNLMVGLRNQSNGLILITHGEDCGGTVKRAGNTISCVNTGY